MAIFNYAAREMTAKIVYYGPGLSGKTTSIQFIHSKINPKNKGKLVSLATETDRTLFFDFFPVEFGQISGFKVKFNFYTVPGQVFYNTTRKLVLKGVDGIVFVADSQPGMMDQNLESLENLKENLKTHGVDWETAPFVIQYNKRDMPGALSVAEMRPRLNPRGGPDFETSATTGMGIMEAMKSACKLVLEDIQRKQKRGPERAGATPATATPAQAPAAQAGQQPSPPAPPAAGKPAPASPRVNGVGVERATVVAVGGSGTTSLTLRVPLDVELPEDAGEVKLQVTVRVQAPGARQVTIGALAAASAETSAPQEEPKKKGLFSRLFGG